MTLDLRLLATKVFASYLKVRTPGWFGLVQYLCETRKIQSSLGSPSRNIY